jgi:hypothetical protein
MQILQSTEGVLDAPSFFVEPPVEAALVIRRRIGE